MSDKLVTNTKPLLDNQVVFDKMKMNRKKHSISPVETHRRRQARLIRIIKKGITDIQTLRRDNTERLATIRRDLESIEKDVNFIRYFNDKTIIAFSFVPDDSEFMQDIMQRVPEKQAIGKYIVEHFIDYGDIIFLDSGTTIFYTAVQLVQSHFEDLTIVTNNTYLFQLLSGKFELQIIGGSLERKRGVILKSPAYSFDNQGLKKSFISVTGLAYDKGAFCEARLVNDKKEVIFATKEQIVFIADHSKIGRTVGEPFAFFQELEMKNIDYRIITDDNFVDEESKVIFETEKGKFPENQFITVKVSEETRN